MVQGCRYSSSHTTHGHKCGTCGNFGHGVRECAHDDKIRALHSVPNLGLPGHLTCQVPNCPMANEHTTDSHICDECDTLGGDCACKKKKCPVCMQVGFMHSFTVFTGAECAVCYAPSPMVVFISCRHANVCEKCAQQL